LQYGFAFTVKDAFSLQVEHVIISTGSKRLQFASAMRLDVFSRTAKAKFLIPMSKARTFIKVVRSELVYILRK